MGPVGFDLDMTLIDSRPAILASFAELAGDTATAIDLAAVDSRLGIKLEDEMTFWYPPDQRAAAAVIYRRHYVRLAEQMTTALPGAHEALAAVRAAGQRVVIITAKHPISVRAEPAGRPGMARRRAVHLRARAGEGGRAEPRGRGRLRRRQPAGHGRRRGGRGVGRSASRPARSPATTWPARAPTWCSTRSTAFPAWYRAAQPMPALDRRSWPAGPPRGHPASPPPPDTAGAAGTPAAPAPPAGSAAAAGSAPARSTARPRTRRSPKRARMPRRNRRASPPSSRQPASQARSWLVVGRQRPVPQPLGDLARRVDDERLLAAAGHAVHPALAGARPCRMLAELNRAPMASAATTCPASCQAVCTAAVRAGA